MNSSEENTKPQGTRWFGWFLVAVIIIMGAIILVQRTTRDGGGTDKYTIELDEDNFGEMTASGVVLVDVWAEWCKPCMAMEPAIQSVAREMQGRAVVGKLHADKNRNLTTRLGVEVLPTLLIYKDGVEVERLFGMHTEETLLGALEHTIERSYE